MNVVRHNLRTILEENMPEIIYERCRDCRLLDICDPNYNSEPACFQKAMESQTTVVQQLQAKIAALTIRLETYVRG